MNGSCEHGVPLRQWYFRDEAPRNYNGNTGRVLVVLNAESCPNCLLGRVADLHEAISLLLGASKPSEEPENRRRFEEGLRFYYADIRKWDRPYRRTSPPEGK